MPIKLYQYAYGKIKETSAERETDKFWIINGRRESKTLTDYPEQVWYRTPEEAARAIITYAARKRDNYLAFAQQYQDKIDEASGFLLGLEKNK